MTRRVLFVNLAVALIASAFWAAIGSLVVPHALHTDFLSFYSGGLLARRGLFHQLYDAPLQASVEKALVPDSSVMMPFIRPPFYAALLAPLTLLPLAPAFCVWLSTQVAALLGCWWWLARRFGYDALVFASLYYPTSVGLSNGQDPVWMLVIFLSCYALAERKRDWASGALLGLAIIKFHLLFLLPLAMALDKRWRMLAGFCAVCASAIAISLALGGTGIIVQYIDLLQRHDIKTLDPVPVRMISIRSLALNAGWDSPLLNALLIGVVVLLLLVAAWRAPLWRWFAAACTGTLLVAPHVYGYDTSILLLPLLLAIFCSTNRFTRIAAATVAIPIPYMVAFFGPPYSAAPVLAIFLFLIALSWESHLERSHVEACQLAELVSHSLQPAPLGNLPG
ncbi:MAG TPA: glycosyltransferase family 87 protein [Bryobacteraceae bacterium]|nr:glycosyltransferase family 87 protein [Bryobacteraceae bacterium]